MRGAGTNSQERVDHPAFRTATLPRSGLVQRTLWQVEAKKPPTPCLKSALPALFSWLGVGFPAIWMADFDQTGAIPKIVLEVFQTNAVSWDLSNDHCW